MTFGSMTKAMSISPVVIFANIYPCTATAGLISPVASLEKIMAQIQFSLETTARLRCRVVYLALTLLSTLMKMAK